jgi:hypothetical protein
MLGNSSVTAELAYSREGLSYMELYYCYHNMLSLVELITTTSHDHIACRDVLLILNITTCWKHGEIQGKWNCACFPERGCQHAVPSWLSSSPSHNLLFRSFPRGVTVRHERHFVITGASVGSRLSLSLCGIHVHCRPITGHTFTPGLPKTRYYNIRQIFYIYFTASVV